MTLPLVSIIMITYNHERFIAQAIEGVLMQETGFPFELVIGEDCSTDGTRAVCEKYAREHPDRIRLLPAERNLGMNLNARRTLRACRGKYIANCEGDDLWTDAGKLQRQAEYLETHPECVLVCGAARIVWEGDDQSLAGDSPLRPFPFPPAETTVRDLARFGGYIITPTNMYRYWLGAWLPVWAFS